MNKKQLIDLLAEIAEKDLVQGCDIEDHPCCIAIRAIDQCFRDIETLRKIAPKKKGGKRVQMLTGLGYNPSW